MLNTAEKGNGQEKCSRLDWWAANTHWSSAFDETVCVNVNQHDLAIAMRRSVAPGGVDERLRLM